MLGRRGSQVPRCSGAWAPGWRGARAPGLRGAKVLGRQGIRVPRFSGDRLPGCRGVQAHGIRGAEVLGRLGTGVPRCSGAKGPGAELLGRQASVVLGWGHRTSDINHLGHGAPRCSSTKAPWCPGARDMGTTDIERSHGASRGMLEQKVLMACRKMPQKLPIGSQAQYKIFDFFEYLTPPIVHF